jgi:hypothetical protein
MESLKHREKALSIERSLAKCSEDDIEIRIEAAMLAATHWVNLALHGVRASDDDHDIMHTYMLTVNEFRRLSAANADLLAMLAEIEDLRPLYVRGDVADGRQAADRACALLARIREIATAPQSVDGRKELI